MSNLPPIPHVEGTCFACGNDTLIMNNPSPLDGRLPMPNLPVHAIACSLEGCSALYEPIDRTPDAPPAEQHQPLSEVRTSPEHLVCRECMDGNHEACRAAGEARTALLRSGRDNTESPS